MDPATIAAFTGVAALLVMSPGPNGVLIAKTVPTSGKLAGFANVAGFMSAFYLHGTLAIFGISVILVKSAELFAMVKLLGAAYLCWIGIRALVDAWRGTVVKFEHSQKAQPKTLVKAYFEGLLTNTLNPKVSLFYLAAFPQFLHAGSTITDAFMLVVIHSLLNLVWFSAIIFLLARFTSAFRGGNLQRWLKGVTGVVFVGFGAKLATIHP